MKKYLITLMALCMAFCLAFAVSAIQVAGEDSYASLMSDGTLELAPEEAITAKELMSVAVRLHSSLNDGGLASEYNLDTYYAYATTNGIFADGVYTAETDIPTRAQVVTALYNAVNGKIDLTAINEVLDMVDVDPNADYHAAASAFMKAGIIYGYDEYASFKPSNTVKRYEISLMVDRLLNPAERVTKDYIVYSSDEPFYLIDDFILDQGARGWYTGGSGWRIDYTGSTEIGTINNYANVLRDFAVDDNMGTYRKIHTQTEGELVFETVYEITAGNTLHFAFYDTDGNVIAITGWQTGFAYINDMYSPTTIALADKQEPYRTEDVNQFNYYMAYKARTRVVLDLDEGVYKVWMGSSYLGEAALGGKKNLAKVGIYTGDAELTTVDLDNTHLYKNYNVNDVFRLENQDEAPVGYEVSGNVTVERLTANANNTGEVNSMKIVTAAGETATAARSFEKANGKVIAEAYVLLENGTAATTVENNAYFTIRSSGADVLKVETKGNNWYVGSTLLDLTTPNDAFTSNVWQWIRIEADTNTQTALIKINGKVAGENIPFLVKVDGFDGLEVGVVGTTADDVIYFDDIEVYETFEYDDYCPTPTPLDTGDYILNMSVCNLWRNGSHYGWDWIRPYSELEPVLGYYDEGIPEAMDWEIKYLVEHGISNYMTCWYPHSGGVPTKKPRMVDALHDGYFNAKYSDMMTFSLMFENSGYISDAQREDFVNNTFPLWMDWYFSDPRYFRIEEDGKSYIFLTIYQYLYFLDMCCTDYELLTHNTNGDLYLKDEYQPSGDTPSSVVLEACADAAAMIDWMEQQIIAAGYADGLIVVYGGSRQSNAAYNTMANMGGDGIILYAWGDTACDVETQKTLVTEHTASAKSQGIDLLALATPGFNDIGWTTFRPGYMSTDNFDTMLTWHKEQMATNFGSSADTWKSKLITFDTWNEFGEGHYLFPTAAHDDRLGYGGFGYLDVIADKFGGVTRGSTEAEANNTVPTAIQKARIGHMYPDDNDHYIRREMIEEVELANAFKNVGGYAEGSFASDLSDVTTKYAFNTTEETSECQYHSSSFMCMIQSSKCVYTKTTTHTYPEYNSTEQALYLLSSPTCNSAAPMRIDLEESEIAGVNMDDVSYIRMRIGTTTGGSYGKIYFKNTTDTSAYDGYAEERIFTFNTYAQSDCENGKYHEYMINVKEHKKWTGTLAGIMLECVNEANEGVYIYSFEFITEDESTKKPTIYVDRHKYECKDYAEIRTAPSTNRDEIYIAPTEEGGLYKLLHMVYDWNRSTNVLKLDTPNGTTFEFTIGSNVAKVNGSNVTLAKAVELYDGAPVIPLIYILKTAGYVHSYDFTNKRIDVTVANSFEIDDQLTNGDAEGTDTAEWFSGSTAYAVSVETDSTDSSNKVWQVNTPASNTWAYIRTNFVWEAGKTYTIDFDARRTGLLGDGTDHPETSSNLVFNARYADTAGTNGVEHNPTDTRVAITDDWQHFTITYTVAETLDTTADTSTHQLTFYVDPYNSLGVPYQMDNIVVRTEPLPFTVLNGDAEDTTDDPTDTTGFRTGNSGNPLTIETDTDGNHYWLLTSTQTVQSWSYIIQDTTFEKGVTYYYTVRAKIGQDGNGADVSNARIFLNARYYDSSQLGNSGEWYSHSYALSDSTGTVHYFNTGDDWVTFTGSFTITQGYDHDTHGTDAREQITFYCNPVGAAGITFMVDDFRVSTDPDAFAS